MSQIDLQRLSDEMGSARKRGQPGMVDLESLSTLEPGTTAPAPDGDEGPPGQIDLQRLSDEMGSARKRGKPGMVDLQAIARQPARKLVPAPAIDYDTPPTTMGEMRARERVPLSALQAQVDLGGLTPHARSRVQELDALFAGQKLRGRITSARRSSSHQSHHNTGNAIDLVLDGDMAAHAERLRQQGYRVQFERKGQVNKNGSVASGDHIHVTLLGGRVAKAQPTPTPTPAPMPKPEPGFTLKPQPVIAPPVAKEPIIHPTEKAFLAANERWKQTPGRAPQAYEDRNVALAEAQRAFNVSEQAVQKRAQALKQMEVKVLSGKATPQDKTRFTQAAQQYDALAQRQQAWAGRLNKYGQLPRQHNLFDPLRYSSEKPPAPGALQEFGSRLYQGAMGALGRIHPDLPAAAKEFLPGEVTSDVMDQVQAERINLQRSGIYRRLPQPSGPPQQRQQQIAAKNQMLELLPRVAGQAELRGGRPAQQLYQTNPALLRGVMEAELGRPLTPWEKTLFHPLVRNFLVEEDFGNRIADAGTIDAVSEAAQDVAAAAGGKLLGPLLRKGLVKSLVRPSGSLLSREGLQYLVSKGAVHVGTEAAGGGVSGGVTGGAISGYYGYQKGERGKKLLQTTLEGAREAALTGVAIGGTLSAAGLGLEAGKRLKARVRPAQQLGALATKAKTTLASKPKSEPKAASVGPQIHAPDGTPINLREMTPDVLRQVADTHRMASQQTGDPTHAAMATRADEWLTQHEAWDDARAWQLPKENITDYLAAWNNAKDPVRRHVDVLGRAAKDEKLPAEVRSVLSDATTEMMATFRDGFRATLDDPFPPVGPPMVSAWRRLDAEQRRGLSPDVQKALLALDAINSQRVIDPSQPWPATLKGKSAAQWETQADTLYQKAQEALEREFGPLPEPVASQGPVVGEIQAQTPRIGETQPPARQTSPPGPDAFQPGAVVRNPSTGVDWVLHEHNPNNPGEWRAYPIDPDTGAHLKNSENTINVDPSTWSITRNADTSRAPMSETSRGNALTAGNIQPGMRVVRGDSTEGGTHYIVGERKQSTLGDYDWTLHRVTKDGRVLPIEEEFVLNESGASDWRVVNETGTSETPVSASTPEASPISQPPPAAPTAGALPSAYQAAERRGRALAQPVGALESSPTLRTQAEIAAQRQGLAPNRGVPLIPEGAPAQARTSTPQADFVPAQTVGPLRTVAEVARQRAGIPEPKHKPAADLSKVPPVVAAPDAATRTPMQEARVRGEAAARDYELSNSTYKGPERRKSREQRQRVAEMTPEERAAALFADEKTGLKNERAYLEGGKADHQVAIDADSLKWINDNFGHPAGDQLLRNIGDALKAAGLDGFHVSGDEFVVQGNDLPALKKAMAFAEDFMANATITIKQGDETKTYKGLSLSYAIKPKNEQVGNPGDANYQPAYADADAALNAAVKPKREREGLRAPRGERPPGFAEVGEGAGRTGGRDRGADRPATAGRDRAPEEKARAVKPAAATETPAPVAKGKARAAKAKEPWELTKSERETRIVEANRTTGDLRKQYQVTKEAAGEPTFDEKRGRFIFPNEKAGREMLRLEEELGSAFEKVGELTDKKWLERQKAEADAERRGEQPWQMTAAQYAKQAADRGRPAPDSPLPAYQERLTAAVKAGDLKKTKTAYVSQAPNGARLLQEVHNALDRYQFEKIARTASTREALARATDIHRWSVQEALRRGKDVPTSVLSDYSDLKPAAKLDVTMPAAKRLKVSADAAAAQARRAGKAVPESGRKGGEVSSEREPWEMTRAEFDSGEGVVYHGGHGEYQIDTTRRGASTGNPTSDFGAFFTPDKREAERYVRDFHKGKGTVQTAQLSLRNPYKMSFGEFEKIIGVDWNKLGFPEGMKEIRSRVSQIKAELITAGHDGIVVGTPGKPRPQEIIVFNNDSILQHRYAVERALAAGKPVPPQVLAEYPDLASKAPPSAIPVRAETDDGPQRLQSDTPASIEGAIHKARRIDCK